MKHNWLRSITDRLHDRGALKNTLIQTVYWFFTLIYCELLLQFVAFDAPDINFAYILGFSFTYAAVFSVMISFFRRKAQFVISVLLNIALFILFASQMVYNFVFGTLYSVVLIQQGGAAITSFWKETLLTIWENLPWLLALFVPLIVLILLKKFRKVTFQPTNACWRVILILICVLIQVVTLQCLKIGGTGYFSNHYFYYSDSTTTDQAVDRFGLLTAFRLDIIGTGPEQQDHNDQSYYVPDTPDVDATAPADDNKPIPTGYNVIDIDFDKLNSMTDDEKLLAINRYCSNLRGTNRNAYTGMLKDYNLIVLCAESFASGAIDKDLTPTLYKLANEGIIFNNYYNSYPSNTTDGEYTLCTGLYPDATRSKVASSFYASRKSSLPYCLGNIFNEQRGVTSYAYHNYYGSYYGRDESHPNMGYKAKFAGSGMKFTTSWPASDLEMMEQSVDDYISADKQFHAYYMTFSGHYKYDKAVNPMAVRNWDAVKDLDYSYTAKCYLSCNIELDKALAYLMQRLEEEGVADKTAIVLSGDHFPYGLTDAQYSELIGYKIDNFSKYKSTLLFWVGGLEENIVVDEYCCNADVLPTILNLWGLEFDSRMMAGTDVFSNGDHVAILRDKSFYTDKVWMNASTGDIRYLVPEEELPANYIDNIIKLIETKFSFSTDILNTAYYNFVFEKGSVAVNRNAWYTEEEEAPNKEPEKEPEKVPENNPDNEPENDQNKEPGNDDTNQDEQPVTPPQTPEEPDNATPDAGNQENTPPETPQEPQPDSNS